MTAGGDRGDNTAVHDEICARCDRRICVCPCQCARCAPVEEARCAWCDHAEQRHSAPDGCDVLLCGCIAVPAADRQTDEATQDDGWPVRECDHEGGECHDIAHQTDPAARPAVADAVMADLGAAITEYVTEVRLREALGRLRKRADGMWPVSRNGQLADVALLEAALADALGGEG